MTKEPRVHFVRHLQIFLSSPGDVPAERKIALEVIEQLQYEPHLRGKVFLEPVAWDNPGAGTVMRATMSPQEAIDQGLTKPADCDIVVVIFWMRMGTPLPNPPYRKANGEPYYSGAEWEYENAVEAAGRNKRAGPLGNAKPEVVVYRRKAVPFPDPDAPDFQEKVEQYERVKKFFAQFRDPKTGAILRGRHEYKGPADFRKQFTHHLRVLVEELLKAPAPPPMLSPSPPPELWHGSPFPGLRAFAEKDAPIFFGRDRETDELVKRINRDRFVTVVGASGAGKSSLVWAGLIPSLKGNAIRSEDSSSADWLWLRMTPGGVGDNPFMALALELKPHLPGFEARDIAAKLAAEPAALAQLILQILSGRPDWAELLLFIDQLEELVTLVRADYRAPFAVMLRQAVAAGRFRAVATLRADFYHQMIPISPALVELLQKEFYSLGAPDPLSLEEMIVRPAERAGLQFEGDLAGRIVNDTGSEPGALALMAYLLDELYQRHTADGQLTSQAYDDLGGVAGAIGKRAEYVFSELSPAAREVLLHVFRRLVEVDERGTATRRRAPLEEIERSVPKAAEELVREFTKARLLVTDTQGRNPTIEVAHEALLRKWDRLADWIEQKQDDLRLLRQVRLAAAEWDQNGRRNEFRWADERLQPVYEMLVEEIEDPDTLHFRRSRIEERLAAIGDPRPGVGLRPDGLPDIDWCKVALEGKSFVEVDVEGVGKVKVDLPFYIARYPMTYIQFQAFIDAADGYGNREKDWFEGLAATDSVKELGEQRFNFPNHPRNVNWYQAMAFCRWVSWRFEALKHSPSGSETRALNLPALSTGKAHPKAGGARGFDLRNPVTWAVRLPTEAEWQFAAAGPSAKTYPWGNVWDARFANTSESGLSRTTAVGMYPAGAAACGALDMSGNVWDWTLTEHATGKSNDISNGAYRVVRGGSWSYDQSSARAACRGSGNPVFGGSYLGFGFRVVGVVPSS
ncbi:MAG: SUMF1/EgtB/PvdO family nonheme iron enzyme [Terracidiphilus sp.]